MTWIVHFLGFCGKANDLLEGQMLECVLALEELDYLGKAIYTEILHTN